MDFIESGSPQVVSRAIEEYATSQGNVSAIVVPWESDGDRFRMAVTAMKGDGWAIEHTNLGTISVTHLGNGATRVAVAADDPDHVDKSKLVALIDRFARQIQERLQVTP